MAAPGNNSQWQTEDRATPAGRRRTAADEVLILHGVNVIDGVHEAPRLHSTVVIRNGRIESVGTDSQDRAQTPAGRVLDLGGLWLLPGLCDAHSHLSSPLQEGPRVTSIDRHIRMGRAAIDALEAGVTTLRVMGAPGYSDVAWRNAFARRTFNGPRLVVAGHIIVPTAGHGASFNFGQIAVADGPDEMRRVVREQIQHDVDFIKLSPTGGVFGRRWDNLEHMSFSQEELRVAIGAARERGYRVAVHAGNSAAIKSAVRYGAHTIEHAYELDDEAIGLMRESGCILVPTLCVTHLTSSGATSRFEREFVRRYPLPDELGRRADARRDRHVAGFRAALEAGVAIASGSDHRPTSEAAFLEIELLVRNGMTPLQAIGAATRVAARACGLEGEIGTVEPGKRADLLVVGGNPLASVENLRKTALVLRDGIVIVDRRARV